MKKYIDVTREVRQDIMAAFNVTGKMVYYALNFDAKRGESDKAKRIRVYAKQKGGIVMNCNHREKNKWWLAPCIYRD